MKTNKSLLVALVCALAAVSGDAVAATKKVSKQSAIQKGTSVRTKTQASGLYDQACYDAYYGCMDQFCISENMDGGSCSCSDLSVEYDKKYADIQKKLVEAERVATEEVEKVKAGANADIIFKGERQYDEYGNILDVDEMSTKDAKAKKRADLMAMFETSYDDEDIFESDVTSIADLVGDALYAAADELCLEQVPEECAGDVQLLKSMYARQIASDCKGYENSLAKQEQAADLAMNQAQADVRTALKESFEDANKYDLGQCMVEFKKCMLTDDACGPDWGNCVSTIADANMQGVAESDKFSSEKMSKAAQSAQDADAFGIAASTLEVMDSKRMICEHVLNQCVVVRDNVWPAFLREAAPTIKVAESSVESKMRQSCLTDISDCIQTACKDDIVGKGKDTMDACLSRPDMARSFCKIEIERCERMEPLIWGYVVDKLAAMRVDACTQEVKDCFTADTRCGENFQNCIGMDYDYIHDICPIDSLVVCKKNNPSFAMSDLDSMLMGLYLNIDNAAMDQCQELVDKKMAEVCGSTTDCNKFAADDTIGTGSVRSQKDGTTYRVTGMISFGSIKMGDASGRMTDEGEDGAVKLGPGEIGVQEYLAQVRERNADVPNADGIIASIEEELNNISGTINRTIEMIESDPEIQFCVNGRDLSQITGKKGQKTTGRFPNLLNQVKMQIAVAALRQAQDNYNAKLNAAIADASADASADVAQYMCQMMPVSGGAPVGGGQMSTELTPPYAISYDVGSGLDNTLLAQGGRGSSATGGDAVLDTTAGASKFSEAVNSFTGLGSNKVKVSLPSGTREMWSVFNRDTRICHYCTSTVTKSCSSVNKKGFLGIGAKNEMNCTESEPIEKCEDIQM